MKKIELITLTAVFVVAIILTFSKIVISTLFTTGGAEYSQVVTEKAVVEKENVQLRQNILTNSSFNTIASEAASMGLSYNKKDRIVLGETAPIAYR